MNNPIKATHRVVSKQNRNPRANLVKSPTRVHETSPLACLPPSSRVLIKTTNTKHSADMRSRAKSSCDPTHPPWRGPDTWAHHTAATAARSITYHTCGRIKGQTVVIRGAAGQALLAGLSQLVQHRLLVLLITASTNDELCNPSNVKARSHGRENDKNQLV